MSLPKDWNEVNEVLEKIDLMLRILLFGLLRFFRLRLCFFYLCFFYLCLFLLFSRNLFAQGGDGFPNFALEGFLEYPFIKDFDTKIYTVIVDFNILNFHELNILNSLQYRHRLSGTTDYFPTHVLKISHSIGLLNEKIFIQNFVSSSGTQIFSSLDSIENRFLAGYNFLNSDSLSLYLGFIVFKGAEFSKELDGVPLPFLYFVYQSRTVSLKFLPVDLSWKPNSLVHLKFFGFFDQSKVTLVFHVADSVDLGPELDFNRDRFQTARLKKDEYVEVLSLKTGLRFFIYYFHGFIGYSFFNHYSIKERGDWVSSKNKVKPGHGFAFDLHFRVEF